MRTPIRPQGFTLIELLVAVTILAVVAALGWRGLDTVAQSRDAARRAFDVSSRLADGMQQLGDDLRNASPAGVDLPAVSVLGGDLCIVRRPPQPLGGDLRAGGGLPPDSGLLQVVRWAVRNGVLVRSAGVPTANRVALLAALQAPVAGAVAILPGVSSMQIQFYRYAGIGLLQQSGAWVNPGTAANAAGTATTATGAQLLANAATPAAVKLQLRFTGRPLSGGLERDFLLDDSE